MKSQFNVAVLIFDGVELVDMNGRWMFFYMPTEIKGLITMCTRSPPMTMLY